ncbi:MAG: DegT/DnrJ/EryC1/StrS family aminotransferase [Thermoanaerobaculia bacterium]
MTEGRIPVAKPWMGEAEVEAARRAILSGWVTQGPEVLAFEQEFADLVGASHACAVSSCTTALHLALRACGIGEGDEVITASYSYIATANAIRHCGAVPVFVDIEDGGPNVDPELVTASIGPMTKAILCVHQMGMPCDVRRLAEIASSHSLPLIEDAACAIGSEITNAAGESEHIGKPHGDISCFSFHPRKIMTTGDGGMITTSRRDWDEQFRRDRQHGMDVPDVHRHGSREIIDETHVSVGYNYRMTDIQAAVGRAQLARLDEMLLRRRMLAARYVELLKAFPVTLAATPAWAKPNWQSFWIQLPAACDRRQLMQTMLDDGIATRRGVHCAHREPAYAIEPWKIGAGGLSRSERAQDRSLVLPLYHELTERDQDKVVSALERALGVCDA